MHTRLCPPSPPHLSRVHQHHRVQVRFLSDAHRPPGSHASPRHGQSHQRLAAAQQALSGYSRGDFSRGRALCELGGGRRPPPAWNCTPWPSRSAEAAVSAGTRLAASAALVVEARVQGEVAHVTTRRRVWIQFQARASRAASRRSTRSRSVEDSGTTRLLRATRRENPATRPRTPRLPEARPAHVISPARGFAPSTAPPLCAVPLLHPLLIHAPAVDHVRPVRVIPLLCPDRVPGSRTRILFGSARGRDDESV